MKTAAIWLMAMILVVAAGSVGAEVLQTRGMAPAPAGSPQNGLSKGQVVQRYGEPQERFGAVGNPPISRWVYPGYSVYFEYDLVLTSVGNR